MEGIRNKGCMAKRILTGVLVALFYLALWTIASIAVGQQIILPSPAAVFVSLAGLAVTADFWVSVGLSLARVVGGYCAGVLLGLLLAGLCHAVLPLKKLTRPLMGVIRATPVASFIILAFYFVSADGLPAFISFLMVLPVIFTNTLEGLAQTDRKLLEMARVFRLPPRRVWTALYIPSALPYAVTAAITALGLAWKAGIAAEVLGSATLSIGSALRESKAWMDVPALFAWTAVIILMSLLLEAALSRGLRHAAARLGGAGLTAGERA